MKYAIGAVVLAGIAALLYSFVFGPKYGISPEHPVGKKESIEKSLVEKLKFEKADVSDQYDTDGTVTEYLDTKRSKKDSIRESVHVLTTGGKVAGVRGVSAIPTVNEGIPRGYRTLFFMKRLWEDAGGPQKREWKTKQVGMGMMAERFKVCTFKHKGVNGIWIQKETGFPYQVIMVYKASAEGDAKFESPFD